MGGDADGDATGAGRAGVSRRVRSASPLGDGASLGAGAVLNGLLAYGFLLVGNRAYGAGFAPVSSVWSVWAVTAAAVTVPVHHAVLRRAVGTGRGTGLGRLLAPAAAIGVVVAVIGYSVRTQLFSVGSVVPPLVCGALVPAATLLGWWRGRASAAGRYSQVGTNLALEGGARLIVALVCVAAGAPAVALTVAILAGYLPTVLTLAVGGRAGLESSPVGSRPGSGGDVAFSAGVAAVALAVQVAQAVPVLATSARSDRADVVGLFNLIAIGRIPLLVGGAMLFRLTHWLSEADLGDRNARVNRILGWSSLPVIALGAALGAVLAPPLLPVLFGDSSQTTPALGGLIGAASAAALMATAGAVLVAVQGRGWPLVGWAGGAVAVGVVAALGIPAEVAVRGASGYLVVTAVLLLGTITSAARPALGPTAGSDRAAPPAGPGAAGSTRRGRP